MSKALTQEELKKLINKSIEKLNNFLDELKSDTKDKKSFKKAGLIAYWIIDYVHMLRQEKTFDSNKLLKYNRGDIISVNFGYRIGSELGGKHFAMVLDNNNSLKSDIITVLPLTSKKEKSLNNYFCYELKHGLYELHEKKLNTLVDKCSKEIIAIANADVSTSEQFEKLSKRLKMLNEKITEAENLNKSLDKLKNGTIVNLGQIATISKIRILNPKKASDSLNKIKVLGEDLDEINKKLNDLYLTKKNFSEETLKAFLSGVNSQL